ncbi:MAG TPA: hypothetical protein VFC02_17455, partial [Anaerolineales bacterium]|nr:hypothetical protein [Anaerolineales bacterium]
MKYKFFFLFLILTLITACSSGQQSTPIVSQSRDTFVSAPDAIQSQPTADSESQTIIPAATVRASTATPKPPLEKDAWMKMPVVPIDISDRAREIYELGLEMGNDPTHFSIIGDCQNVSSYFLSTFDKPGDFSLG